MAIASDEKVGKNVDESEFGSPCPLCWGQHNWTDVHEIVAMAPREDQFKLFAALSRLGVGWPREFNLLDAQERSYGLLRMTDEAARLGLDCSPVGRRWVVTRTKTRSLVRVAA
jgi:hypothetical protein